ncbi:hypothetical protein BSKO_01283 [Bryopsis sp. KO-2023]|nr:hypothetical protein BSKO_01283 [Bryopsis sp. KO-2023]
MNQTIEDEDCSPIDDKFWEQIQRNGNDANGHATTSTDRYAECLQERARNEAMYGGGGQGDQSNGNEYGVYCENGEYGGYGGYGGSGDYYGAGGGAENGGGPVHSNHSNGEDYRDVRTPEPVQTVYEPTHAPYESSVRLWIGVVNLPDNVTKVDVKELFASVFRIHDFRELPYAVTNAAGASREVECIMYPRDANFVDLLEEEFKEQVLKFWFESPLVSSLDPRGLMWLHEVSDEVSAKSTVLKGKTAKVEILGLEMGLFRDQGHFVKRAQFESNANVELYLDFSTRSMVITIQNQYTIEFQTKEVQDFVVVDLSWGASAIYLSMKHPPRIYELRNEDPDGNSDTDIKRRRNNIWTIPVEVFAFCQTYKLQVVNTRLNPAVKNPNVNTALNMLAAVGKEIYYGKVKTIFPKTALPSSQSGIPTTTKHHKNQAVNFAWLCLSTSRGFVIDRFDDSFFEKLNEIDAWRAEAALYSITSIVANDPFIAPLEALKIGCKRGKKVGDLGMLGEQGLHCKLPRVIITPTRILFFEPDIVQTNRVLRHFGEQYRFIRVAIRDENMAKISGIHGQIGGVLNYIEELLNEGFEVGGVKFKFLGASNSQVRDHGCWFVEVKPEQDTARKIRDWIGELSGIKNVAKYLSRLGQGFSTSTETVKISVPDYQLLPDIIRNDYCFTDGIGKITADLAEEIATHLNLPYTPCAYQIRFGGAKGVVAVDKSPNLSRLFPNKRIFVRESMLKYNSQHTTVEVLQSRSVPQELYLNQQLIMLLRNVGVPDEVFVGLLKKTLNTMSQMFIDENVARSKMRSILCGVRWDDLEATGFDITSEPYLRSMLMALYRVQMQNIRKKSRIPVDPRGARMLLGVVDETESLRYGQVFIQISVNLKNPLSGSKVLKQKVVVGKSPCLHPGDVRTFDAVDCPKLRHMVDCIVFPSLGPRPHPNEMSGSDLDGDMYHTIWDPDLMPRRPIYRPMEYPSANEKQVSGEISVPMMIGFLRQSIEHDCLGQIDNTHKAMADKWGLDSDACISLAYLHSQAVDAPKTGQWVSVPGSLRRQITRYPDFMMKQDKPSYPSNHVLGQMFRECNKYLNACSVDMSALGCSETELDRRFEIEGFQEFIPDARKRRQQYNLKLDGLMRIYGIGSEGELMTGFIEKYHEKLGRERSDVAAMAGVVRQKLTERFREEFFMDQKIYADGVIEEEAALRKAAAWYYVTYSSDEDVEVYKVGKTTAVRFLSFPWVVSDYLMKLYKRNLDQGRTKPESVQLEIGRSICAEFKNCEHWLVSGFNERCQLRDSINSVLCHHEGYYALLYGLSATCLFDTRRSNEADLLVMTNDHSHIGRLGRDLIMQKQILRKIKDWIQDSCRHCKIIRTTGLARLRFAGLTQTNWKGHMTVIPEYLVQSMVLIDYIYYNPWLLPLLRVVIGWGMVTGIVGADQNSLLDSLVLGFMVVGFCLDRNLLHRVNGNQIKETVERGGFDEGYFLPDLWQGIIEALYRDTEYMPSLGAVLLEFFRNAEHNAIKIHPDLQGVLGGTYYSQIPNADRHGVSMLKDEMLRAFHRLCMHRTVVTLQDTVKREQIEFIRLEDCRTMIKYEQYYARLLTQVAGADVEVHNQEWSRVPGLLFKINGTNAAIRTAQRQVDYFKRRGQTLAVVRRSFPGVSCLWVKGASILIVEGSGTTAQHDRVLFEDYSVRPRHPDHDNIGLYTLRLTVGYPNRSDPLHAVGSEFEEFKQHLQERFRALKNSAAYSHICNGPIRMEVQFGLLYMVNAPTNYIESPDGVLVQDVKDAVAKTVPEGTVLHPLMWLEEVNNNRSLWRSKLKQPTTKSAIQSFCFSRIDPAVSKVRLKEMLVEEGFREGDVEEGYYLVCRGENTGQVAKYYMNMRLEKVFYPPLKWMVADVNRRVLGKKLATGDIRFEVTSQKFNTVAKELRNGIVNHSSCKKVNINLMSRTEEFRKFRRQEFCRDSSGPWATKVYVDEVEVQSRPKKAPCGRFTSFEFYESTLELRIEQDLMDFYWQGSLPDEFLSDMWKLAWGLSNRLRGMTGRQ